MGGEEVRGREALPDVGDHVGVGLVDAIEERLLVDVAQVDDHVRQSERHLFEHGPLPAS